MNRSGSVIAFMRAGRRRRVLVWGLAVGMGAALAVVHWFNRELPPTQQRAVEPDPDQLARGAYLARVGNCAACHTARGGAAYAGGRALATPFGTVYGSNLTPDEQTGLGRWSADDFWRALHHGRSRDGRLLTPAFPYTEFTHVTRADSDALFAHLRSLPPVVNTPPAGELRFPFNTQLALAVWRWLYFRPAAPDALAEAGRSPQWQRGAYLVRGLGHCAACHAPRNGLGASARPDALAGGAIPMQPWFAPNLARRSDEPAHDYAQTLITLLRSGQSRHGNANGPMAEVVMGSTQHWSDADLQAAAAFLGGLPPQAPPPGPVQKPAPEIALQLARGSALYTDHCAACHGVNGEGAPGIYPALAGNTTVNLHDPGNALQMLKHGGFAPVTAANRRPYGMPPTQVSDQALADVLTYVRQSWGNQAAAVTVLQAMRAP